MGLIKSIESEHGLIATYWRISVLSCDETGTAHLQLSGFPNEAMRRAGKKPLVLCSLSLSPIFGVFDYSKQPEFNPHQKAYALIKQRPEFLGAEDL